jgi:glycosyltransferase involved in cell wall biosynthesis
MSVSIIIPIRNEEKFIGKCLDSFLAQIRGGEDCEILCVDGMSADKTAAIIKEYSACDGRVKLITNARKITPVAMNLGLKEAKGDFVIVVSCHAEYAEDYIAKCVEVIKRTNADHVGGYMTTLPGKDTTVGRAISAATSCVFGIGNSMFRLKGPEREVDTVPFGMYKKTVFEKVGFYDERLVRNQDIELNHRLRKAGGRIIISPEINSSYYNRSTYRGLWQQSFNNGLWNPYTVWLTGGGLSLRHFIPMLFVLGLVVLTAVSLFWRPVFWLLGGYILLYLSVACFFAIRSACHKKTFWFLVLWAFIILHTAYGLGSLWSVITIPFKFADRNTKVSGKPLADRKA